MLIRKINPFLENLNLIIEYGKSEFKILNDGLRIIKDDRYYLQGMRRYLDSSGDNNIQKIGFIIINTYLQICYNIQIPINNKDYLFKIKLEKYLLILSSLTGLNKLVKKYNLISEQEFILSILLPDIKKSYEKNFQ